MSEGRDPQETGEPPSEETARAAGGKRRPARRPAEEAERPAAVTEGETPEGQAEEARELFPVATARAEELLDRAGEQVGRFASELGVRLRRAAARAREEAEDVWAEAQALRRRE